MKLEQEIEKLKKEKRKLESSAWSKKKLENDRREDARFKFHSVIIIMFGIMGLFPFFSLVSQGKAGMGFTAFAILCIPSIIYIVRKSKQREILNEIVNQNKIDNKRKEDLIRIIKDKEKQLSLELENKEELRLEDLSVSQKETLKELDKDGNGVVDDIEDNNDFDLLLKKHQQKIIEINRDYIKEFVKVSSYLKNKKKNIQLIFNSLKDTSKQSELEDYVKVLKKEVHTYKLVLFNSLNMIVSLTDDDMITFYEIHDSFDKLNMFNSNWENELSQKLSSVNKNLDKLIISINQMSQNIIDEIGHLSYVTDLSNEVLNSRLGEINSSIEANNFLTGIQAYQTYKLNKNVKQLS